MQFDGSTFAAPPRSVATESCLQDSMMRHGLNVSRARGRVDAIAAQKKPRLAGEGFSCSVIRMKGATLSG